MKVSRLSALRNGRLYPHVIFLVLISVRGFSQPQDHSAAGRIMSMKKSSNTIGNRTRDVVQIATHHVTRHNTPIHNILSTAAQLSFSQKALGTFPENGIVMPKHVGVTIHN
jgi:hypothetical protein